MEGELDHPLLEQQEVGQDRLVILVHPSHAWADGRTLRDRDLTLVSWVMREQGSGTRSTLEAVLAAAGCDPSALSITMTLPSNEAVLSAVQAGAGVTALSEHVAHLALTAGQLAAARFALPERSFHLLRHRERYSSRAADAFAAMMV